MAVGGLSPARWAKTQSPVALMVVRLLLVANGSVLVAVGALCAAFMAWPEALVAIGVWGLAVALLALVPYTNPRRGSSSNW